MHVRSPSLDCETSYQLLTNIMVQMHQYHQQHEVLHQASASLTCC